MAPPAAPDGVDDAARVADHQGEAPVAPVHSDIHHLHAEFGETADAVLYHGRADSHASSARAGSDAPEKRAVAPEKHVRYSKEQWRRLRRHLFRPRMLRQYFVRQDVLVRERALRKISNEELYLDLIIVASIAAIAHELRHNYDGWPAIENFILLFGAVYYGWRSLMFLWNMFGVAKDVVDKLGIFLQQVAISGIGLGAHVAFTRARVPVAVCAFMATAAPAMANAVFSLLDPASSNEHNMIDQNVFGSVLQVLSAFPFLVAAFREGERFARNCYWVALGLGFVFLPVSSLLYQTLHRKRPLSVRLAVNIESMVEKYGVFTLIVLGESLMALLFEGSELLAIEGSSVARLFGGVFAGIVVIYSLMTLYFNVDNHIPRGAKHAIRSNRYLGLAWAMIHVLYHMTLAGFLSTGIGLMLRDITVAPGSLASSSSSSSSSSKALAGTLSAVARAGGGEGTGTGYEAQFSTSARWLFSAAWLSAIAFSSLMGLVHEAGPRGTTKNRRIAVRVAIAVALAVALPFTDISAFSNLGAFAAVTAAFAAFEFLFVEMDRIGMLAGHGGLPLPSTTGSVSGPQSSIGDDYGYDYDDDDDEPEMDPADDTERPKGHTEDGAAGDVDSGTAALREEARRLGRRRTCRLEAICHAGSAAHKATPHH